MDYDGNDISCHNLKLADEGRTKSSPLLQPYDFPKFDFSESLQGNLRFDSLVESEVFLGIESQQDSQWIEDFSQGTNGMEFNSAPADSCPISRKNNVWSEATSSESVEMLLKSVGQEEMMPEKSTILVSNACDDQDTLTEHVEPGIKKDTAVSELTAPVDELLNDDPAPKVQLEEQLPETEMSSATHVCGKDGTSTNEEIQSYQDSNLGESKTSDKVSLHSRPGDGSFLVADNNNYDAGDLSTLKASEQVNADFKHGCCSGESQEKRSRPTGQEDSKSSEAKIDEAIKDTHNTCSSPCSATELGGSNNQGTVETTLECVRETNERESEMKSPEKDSKDASFSFSIETSKHEIEVSPASRAIIGPFEGFRDGSSVNILDQHSAESANFASPEQMVSPCVQLTSGHGEKVEDLPKDIVASNNVTMMPLSSGDDNYVPIESCNPINETAASKSSDIPVLSMDKQPGYVEGGHIESIVASQEAGVLSPVAVEHDYEQVIEENLAHRQADFSGMKQNISKIEENNEEQPISAGNLNSKNVGLGTLPAYEETQSLDLSEVVTLKDSVYELQHQTVGEVGLENDATPCATRITTATLDDDPKVEQGEPVVDRSSPHPDNDCEEAATRMDSNVNFSTEVYSITKIKEIVTDEAPRSPLSDIALKRLQPPEKSNDIYIGKSPSMDDTKSMYSHHSQADLGYHTSSLKESVNVDLVSEKNQDMTMMKPEGEKETEQAAETDKSSCGSPTIISSSEPSEMNKYQEESRASVNESISACAKPKEVMVDDTSFTFKVNALPDTTEGEPGKSWLPFNAEKSKLSVVVDEISPCVKRKVARTPSTKTPRQSAQGSDGIPKGTSERKGRRASAKGTAKENAKGNRETDVHQGSPLVKGDKIPGTLLSMSSSSPRIQFGMTPPYGLIEQSNTKLSSAVAAPHLKTNKSSPSASFRQSFTDLQQVQLRAQIFVYGSLIQGTAPDEACMVSAFGPFEGGRSIWEPVWRGAVERVRSQKPNSTTDESPLLHIQSGTRASDAVNQISHSSKVPASPVGRYNSKGTVPAITNPTIPFSSPLWSISTPSRDNFPSGVSHKGPTSDYLHAVMPFHSYQTPPIKNFAGQTWPQACFPGPWLASPQTSTFNSSICFQPITTAEPVKLTLAKGTPGPLTDIKHVMSTSSSPANEGASSLPDVKPVEKHSVDSKPKKKKKVSGSDPHRVSLLSEFQSEPVVVPNPFTNLSSVVAISTPASPSPDILTKATADTPSVFPVDLSEHGNIDTGKAITCSEETMSKIAEAKNQAEDASAFAALAVSHSENIWSQLAKQKESGLTSEAEVKLATSAIVISAAASVAKAAAAAAKVAYSISLQAKKMADEACLSCKRSSSERSSIDVQDVGCATPVSILKGDNISSQSDSIIVTAEDAAKKKVDADSCASKQAENMDAIVKAAELATTAVSQASKIVAMGEPLSLGALIKAGPDSYWKSQHSPELAENVMDQKEQESTRNLGKDFFLPAKVSESPETAGQKKTTCPKEMSNDPLDGCVSLVDGIMGPMHTCDREFKCSGGSEVSDAAKCSTEVSQPDTMLKIGTTSQVKHDELADPAPEDSIKEASLVEVFKREDGLKAAWYAANVLRLEEGKAYVCYSDLLSEEGSENLCEWIPLEREGSNAPIIRAAHPLTTLSLQATRKRRRSALGDYAWSVGDRVDVWIDDCWWEGVVAEKNEKDATTLKVHFPAQGETSTVRAWNLRTSRTWTDGKWVECSSSREKNAFEQGDTPHEKRQKLDKLATDMDSGSEKPDQSKVLPLSTSDRTFNIGKTAREDKRAPQRPLKSGQQKEGSKVKFGVPKPTGKKRKFMEVSKHFPPNRNDKSYETNNSAKFAKYLMPQATPSRGWKAPLRNDPKEKRTAVESRSRGPNSRIASRIIPRRENEPKDSDVHDENEPEKLVEPGSSPRRETPEVPLSSLLANTFSSASKRLSSYTRSVRVNRGKAVPSRGKLNTIVEEKNHDANAGSSVTEGSQPRRSNRRIQPTHRLLEGLQSSLIIPKMPSVSHDKGPRSQSKNISAKGR